MDAEDSAPAQPIVAKKTKKAGDKKAADKKAADKKPARKTAPAPADDEPEKVADEGQALAVAGVKRKAHVRPAGHILPAQRLRNLIGVILEKLAPEETYQVSPKVIERIQEDLSAYITPVIGLTARLARFRGVKSIDEKAFGEVCALINAVRAAPALARMELLA
jgi:hypothetical protein